MMYLLMVKFFWQLWQLCTSFKEFRVGLCFARIAEPFGFQLWSWFGSWFGSRAEISALWLPIQLWSCGSHGAKFPAPAPRLWLPRAVSLHALPLKNSGAFILQSGSRSQSLKLEPRAGKSAPIDLVCSRSCTNGSGYDQMCPGS